MCPKCGLKMKKGTTEELENHLYNDKPVRCKWRLKISGYVKRKVFKRAGPVKFERTPIKSKPVKVVNKPVKGEIKSKEELEKVIKEIEEGE